MKTYVAEPVSEFRAEHATPTQRVDVFDVDPGGEPVARRTAFTIEVGDGAPDGMCMDHEGCLWVALWGKGQVRRYTPDGGPPAAPYRGLRHLR